MKLSIIVPCYNESENVTKLHTELLPVIQQIISKGWQGAPDKQITAEITFVDDGSRDGTYTKLQDEFANKPPDGINYKFLKHDINRGLGAAIRTGFLNADGDIIVTMDSDGTYRFSSLPQLLSRLRPDIDLVTASPYHPQGEVVGVPAYRLLLSQGSSLLYRILVTWKIHTYTCLYRAYRAKVIKNIDFQADDFLAGTEILVKAMLQGYRVEEFPAALHRREFGVSKARIAQTILSHLKFQARILWFRSKILFGFGVEQNL